GQAALAQDARVLVGVLDVHQGHPPARLQDPGDLAHGLLPPLAVGDVVQGQAGKDDVERAVREGQGTGVAVPDLDAVGDPLPSGVLAGRLGAVAAQVLALPEVNTGRLAGGQAAGGADQQQAPAAADVQHRLVAAPGDQVQEPLPGAELDDLAVVHHAG